MQGKDWHVGSKGR